MKLSGWETLTDKAKRYLKISPKMKLTILRQIAEAEHKQSGKTKISANKTF